MPGRILVVDNLATNRIVLKVKLASACYDVLQASDGAEALRVARRDRPDLVLLDAGLPDLDGLEVCKRLKTDARTSGIPVIIVTGSDDNDAKLAALEAGADEFMSRPLEDMGFLARIRSLLRDRDIASELALREGTSQALGFADAGMEFVSPGRICLVADDETRGSDWCRTLQGKLDDKVEFRTRAGALSENGPAPDLFILTADRNGAETGLQLLPELRWRPETRHSGIIMVVPPDNGQLASMALDMGASDLVTLPVNTDELVLRLKAMMKRKRQADRLRRKIQDGLNAAVTDPLTGLYNRRYAMSHLDRVQQRALASGKQFAVMLADLDRFKQVNDTYGHVVGDTVLKQVATRLSANLRSVDLIARIGGEEFLVVLPDIAAEGAIRAAERLREAVEREPISLAEIAPQAVPPSLNQTVSIGLVVGGGTPRDGLDDISQLIDRADRALYGAKTSGRNRVILGKDQRAAA